MTSSQSDSSMLKLILSRRMPALFTRMSSWPKVSTAWSIRSLAPDHELTSEVFTAPSLPPVLMSSTTSSAGCLSPPDPSNEAPTSLTMTLAPSDASSSASSRPIPRPAPVTMATLPSSIPMLSSSFWSLQLMSLWSMSRCPHPKKGPWLSVGPSRVQPGGGRRRCDEPAKHCRNPPLGARQGPPGRRRRSAWRLRLPRPVRPGPFGPTLGGQSPAGSSTKTGIVRSVFVW